MAKLTGIQIVQLQEIIKDAFSEAEFVGLLLTLNKQLTDYQEHDDTYPAAILNVIMAAERHEWIAQLLSAIVTERRDKPGIQDPIAQLRAHVESTASTPRPFLPDFWPTPSGSRYLVVFAPIGIVLAAAVVVLLLVNSRRDVPPATSTPMTAQTSALPTSTSQVESMRPQSGASATPQAAKADASFTAAAVAAPATPTWTASATSMPTPTPVPGSTLCNPSALARDRGLEAIWIEEFHPDSADKPPFEARWKMEPSKSSSLFRLEPNGAPCGSELRIVGKRSASRELPPGSRPTYIAYTVKPQTDRIGTSVEDTIRGELVVYANSCASELTLLATKFEGDQFRTSETFGASVPYSTRAEPGQWHLVELRLNWEKFTYDVRVDGSPVQEGIPYMIQERAFPVGCVALRNSDNSVSEWDTIVVAGSADVPPMTPTRNPRPESLLLPFGVDSGDVRESGTKDYPGPESAFCIPEGYRLDTDVTPLGYDNKIFPRKAEVTVVRAETGDQCVPYLNQSALLHPPAGVSPTSPGYRLRVTFHPGPDAANAPAFARGAFLLYARLGAGGVRPSSTPTPVAVATKTPPALSPVSVDSVHWGSLLEMSDSYDEGTDGAPDNGTTNSYLTYPGSPGVTFSAGNRAVIRYPYECRKRYKTYLFGREISTKDSQHPAEIQAQVTVMPGNTLSIQGISPVGGREGRCANSIITHLQNLSGRLVVPR